MSDISLEEDNGSDSGNSANAESGFTLLSEAEKRLLVSLPYRVGFWISQADDRGGEESDKLEIVTLESLITSYAQDMCKSEFMQSLMEETVKSKASWSEWQKDIDRFPGECQKACKVLEPKLNEKSFLGFRENMLEIAVCVAEVFQEEEPERQTVAVLFKKLMSLFTGKANGYLDSTNISSRERAALNTLSKILDI